MDRVAAGPLSPRLRRGAATLYRHSAVRYLAVGGASFIVDFSLIFLLHDVVGASIAIATALAFLASFAFTYTLQRLVSFTSTSSHGVALVKYVALVAFNTVATTVVVAAFDSSIDGWQLGKVVATLLTTLWNYFIYRYWIFVKPAAARPTSPEQSSADSEPRDV